MKKTDFIRFIIKLRQISIDLKWAYYQIRIKEGNKWKGVFKTKKGLFKPTVLQFRFINTLVIFQ